MTELPVCVDCDKTITGGIIHCLLCHESFNGRYAFDIHNHGQRVCDVWGLWMNDEGNWE